MGEGGDSGGGFDERQFSAYGGWGFRFSVEGVRSAR
jgi:hypothetical protein